VAAADQWRRSVGNAPPEQIAAGANAQAGWDPSVKALTAYPQVLAMLDQNLDWTTALGNAYYNQPQDLLQTVQVMRQRAESAGNLQNTPQEQVTDSQGYIGLAPANPEMVYVPTYNPWVVYGQPIAPYPNYSPMGGFGSILGTAVQYGLGFATSAFMHTPFGLLSWGLDWLAHAVLFNHSTYYSHSMSVADWGFPHGGPRAFRGGEFAHYGDRSGRQWNSYRNEQGFNRGVGYPATRAAQSYQNRYGSGFDRGGNYGGARPAQSFDGRNQGGYNRGYQGYGTARPSDSRQIASNRMPDATGRPQQPYQTRSFASQPQQFSNYGQRNGVGSNSYSRPALPYGGSRSPSYAAPSQSYRAPTPNFSHGGYGQQGNAFAGGYGQSGHSGGGFHMFGGGHSNSQSFGGGGHSSGGGHSFSGGHSGGGHSSGGHSGGGGHGHSHRG
jgi:hypothetical protein